MNGCLQKKLGIQNHHPVHQRHNKNTNSCFILPAVEKSLLLYFSNPYSFLSLKLRNKFWTLIGNNFWKMKDYIGHACLYGIVRMHPAEVSYSRQLGQSKYVRRKGKIGLKRTASSKSLFNPSWFPLKWFIKKIV